MLDVGWPVYNIAGETGIKHHNHNTQAWKIRTWTGADGGESNSAR